MSYSRAVSVHRDAGLEGAPPIHPHCVGWVWAEEYPAWLRRKDGWVTEKVNGWRRDYCPECAAHPEREAPDAD